MNSYALQLDHLSNRAPELCRTRFEHPQPRRIAFHCVRGRTSGAHFGQGTFEWSRAVRGLCVLALRAKLSPWGLGENVLEGVSGSLAASLDYAIDKQPNWMTDMFGVDARGMAVLRNLIARSNSGRKRPGPVTLAFKPTSLPSDCIQVRVDGELINDPTRIASLVTTLSKDEDET